VTHRGTKNGARQGLPFHNLANVFPLIDGPEFGELVADIKSNGLRDKIVLHQGQILDGRNRYRACIEVGLFKPSHDAWVHLKRDSQHFLDLPRTLDPVNFVISKNLLRRHLHEGARSIAAAKIANMRQGERTDTEPSANLRKVSQADAARMLKVSERSVTDAVKVIKKGSKEIAAAVTDGKLSVSQAAVAADLDAADQAEVVKVAMEGNKKAATEKIKQKRRPKRAKVDKAKKEKMAQERKQHSDAWKFNDVVLTLAGLASDYGLGRDEGYECRPFPDHLLDYASYDAVVAAHGILGHIKYAMEREQMAEQANTSESIVFETGPEPDTTFVVTDAELAGSPVANQGPVLPPSVTSEAA
jgi:ParB-like chromosome segregation protein Spo0J